MVDSAPRQEDQEETGVREAIQRLALAHSHYGYRTPWSIGLLARSALPRERFRSLAHSFRGPHPAAAAALLQIAAVRRSGRRATRRRPSRRPLLPVTLILDGKPSPEAVSCDRSQAGSVRRPIAAFLNHSEHCLSVARPHIYILWHTAEAMDCGITRPCPVSL
jgi:hypothetical protein